MLLKNDVEQGQNLYLSNHCMYSTMDGFGPQGDNGTSIRTLEQISKFIPLVVKNYT